MRKCGLLLINLGTPDEPRTREVRRYLREFLSDPRVLDMAAWKRSLILNLLILPFRPGQAAEAYRKIWTERGSPLKFHGVDLTEKVRDRLGPDVHVELAMRYQNPSISSALERMRSAGVEEIVAFPLFPQYASSSTGSALEKVFVEMGALWNVPSLHSISTFHDHPAFLECFAARARPLMDAVQPDAVLMSFHGLPESQILKGDDSGGHCLRDAKCCASICEHNRFCYRAQCYSTARGIAERIGLGESDYQVTFQSRLGRAPWIKPYTDIEIVRIAKDGKKRLVVFSPAFIADCLETVEEIGMRARDSFISNGGDILELVPSLNSEDAWADAVVRIAREGSILGLVADA